MILLKTIIDGTQNGTLNSYFDSKVIKLHFSKMENQQNSRVCKILSKYHLRTVDTVLESSNIILFDFKTLGTTLGTMVNHITQEKVNFHDFPIFCIWIPNANYTLWGTQMVPKIFSSKSMDPQLSESVSTKILRLKERFSQLFKVRRKFEKSWFSLWHWITNFKYWYYYELTISTSV